MNDLIIIGTGPAGYSAAIYAKRYGLGAILIGKKSGGYAADAHLIENYPGFKSIEGVKLMQKFEEHVKSLGIEPVIDEVNDISSGKGVFKLKSVTGNAYEAKNVILASGTKHRELNVPGEKQFIGKGVAYCFTCDMPFFKDKTIAVIGGANAAAMAANLGTQYCKKVYVIVRNSKLLAEPAWAERIIDNSKIKILFNTNVVKIKGNEKVESVELDKPYNNSKILKLDGVFVEIGVVPIVDLAKEIGVNIDEKGFIIVDEVQRTNLKGFYAAGDITNKFGGFKQVITAAGQGVVAVMDIYKNLNK